jgi:hypothetical protein
LFSHCYRLRDVFATTFSWTLTPDFCHHLIDPKLAGEGFRAELDFVA